MSNVSNPKLWETVKNKVMKMETAGTKSGQWSARKAQMAVATQYIYPLLILIILKY